VAGAIFSGFAMVLTLAIPVRKLYKMEDFITLRHLDNMAKVTLATGLIVVYGYMTEIFMAYYSGNEFEHFMIVNRFRGPYWYIYWSLFLCNAIVPQALWSRRVRTTPWILFIIAIVVNIGMWLERYTIIVISLARDFVVLRGNDRVLRRVHVPVHPRAADDRHVRDEAPVAGSASEARGRRGGPRMTSFGLVAEFSTAQAVTDAAHAARKAGYRKMDGYSPFPIEALSEETGHGHTVLPWLILGGGLTGGFSGWLLQYWTMAVDYPYLIGGKPFHSWPAFIPVIFECTILFAALTAVFGMIALNGLPRPYHPIFGVPNFERASVDRFFLCIEAVDPLYDPLKTRDFLASQGATQVTEVAA
jgi:hypothetical protein